MTSVSVLRASGARAAAAVGADGRVPERMALFAAIVVMPSDLNIPVGGVTIYLGEAAILVAAVIFLATSLLRGRLVIPRSGYLVALSAYLAWGVVAGMLALATAGTLDLLGKTRTILVALLLASLVLSLIDNPARLNRLIVMVIAGLAVNAALGLVQYTTGLGYVAGQHDNNEWKVDLSGALVAHTANGLFITPNNLGVALIPGLVLAAALTLNLTRQRHLVRALPAAMTMSAMAMSAMALALLVTFNRGAYVWAAIGLLLLLLPRPCKLGQAALLVAASIIALTSLGARDLLLFQDTLVVRLRLWLAALRVFEHGDLVLFIGNGMAQMPYWGALVARWDLPTSHNTWLDQVLLFGLPGLAFYAALWLVPLLAAGRALRHAPPGARVIGSAIIAAIAATAGACFFEPRAEGFYQVGQVALLLAMAAVYARLPPAQP